MLMGLINYLRRRVGNEEGALAVEYGVLVAFVVVIIAGALMAFGGTIKEWLEGLVIALPFPE